MGYAKLFGAQTYLLKATTVDIEVDISRGLHSFVIVGLATKSVAESKDRVAAAIKNSGFRSPKQYNHKIVISLGPAHIRKDGPLFDLGIAIAYLVATDEIANKNIEALGKTVFIGELTLDGSLRKGEPTLPLLVHAKNEGFANVFIPKGAFSLFDSTKKLFEGINIYEASCLREVIDHIEKKTYLSPVNFDVLQNDSTALLNVNTKYLASTEKNIIDWSHINGQQSAKRALIIAALGRHHAVLYGPPGSGKSMLAKAFPHILPDLHDIDALEIAAFHSFSPTSSSVGEMSPYLNILRNKRPPFQSPHHSSSRVTMIGGGIPLAPGALTLAHKGVLCLDELPEFSRESVEALRQPLEEKSITLTRNGSSVQLPADIVFLGTMNPCPCGMYGGIEQPCTCNPESIKRYQSKLSIAFRDRIDMWIRVPRQHTPIDAKINRTTKNLLQKITSSDVRQRITKLKEKGKENETFFEEKALDTLNAMRIKMNMSERIYQKTKRLAQTIAYFDADQTDNIEDLKQTEASILIKESHILEALQYRPPDLFF